METSLFWTSPFFAFPSSPCGPLSLPLPSCLHTPNHSLPHLRPENHKLAGRGHYPLTKTSLESKVQRSNRHCGLQVFFFHSGQALKVTYFQRYDYERLDGHYAFSFKRISGPSTFQKGFQLLEYHHLRPLIVPRKQFHSINILHFLRTPTLKH